MKTIRWGIIGCGDVTEKKSGPAFSKVPGSELVAVMRRNGNAAADYVRRHRVPRWYDDVEKQIHDPGVDAVYISRTPPDTHASYTEAVAEAGKPVYVEKPMARTTARLENSEGVVNFEVPTPEHVQQGLIETVVAELLGETGACPSTGRSALRTNRVLDQITGRI